MENKSKDRRLRIIINTNAPWTSSGYGIWAGMFLKRAIADGWNIALNAFVGHEGKPEVIDGILTYPRLQDTWGSDGILYNSRHFGAHIIINFMDAWTLNPQFLSQVNAEGRKLVYYVPIDQEPVPLNVLNNLKFGYKLITFSQFGHKALQRAGFSSKLIVEGTDPDIFKPLDKAACRKEIGLPLDAFVIGMIGANKENPPRKGWQQALEAFKMFHDKHPEAVFFYLTNQNSPTGFPLMHYAHYLGIDKQIFHIDDYLATFHAGSTEVNKILNCFDILTHASLTEGFGLVIIEAQSAGIPVVVNDCQSQPELIVPEKTGLVCKPGFKWFANAGGFHYFPDTNSLYEKYEQLFRSDREKMGKAARQHIIDNYNINTLYEEKWRPVLEQMQDDLLGKIDMKSEKP